jgi:hypothetical protein
MVIRASASAPAGDLDALLLEEVHDLLIGERFGAVLLADHLLQLRPNGPRAGVLA